MMHVSLCRFGQADVDKNISQKHFSYRITRWLKHYETVRGGATPHTFKL